MSHVCYTCNFRRPVQGDCHIQCGKAFNAEANPLVGVMAILAGVGSRVPAPGPTQAVTFSPKMKHWPGYGSWPSLFDKDIIIECEGWEEAKP